MGAANPVTHVVFVGSAPMIPLAFTGEGDGTVFDLSGCTLWFTVKNLPSDADASAIIQKKTGAGVAITNATGGLAQVQLNAADTALLTPDRSYYFDVQVKTPAGQLITALWGDLVAITKVTTASS